MKATVKELMTCEVHSVRPDAGFKEMVRVIEEQRVGALPVTTAQGRLVGIVSELDLLLKEERSELQQHHFFESKVRRAERDKSQGGSARELMTWPVVTARPEMPVQEAARLMHDKRVKRLPVVDPLGRLVGIISRHDVLKVFLRSDLDIRREIVEDLIVGALWMDPSPIAVAVTDGVVHLSGEVDRLSDRTILRSLAEAVQGVVAVRDEELRYRFEDSRSGPGALVRSGS